LTADKLQEAIKRIYAIGLYADVVIKGEKAGNGVKIRIETKQYPRLAEIRYKGNNKVKTKNLKKQVNLTEGRIVSPGAIKNCVEAIKKLYEEKGYLLAQVESSIEPDKTNPGREVVTLRIDEGQKVRIKNITFTGNAAFSDDKLRGKLGNKRKSFSEAARSIAKSITKIKEDSGFLQRARLYRRGGNGRFHMVFERFALDVYPSQDKRRASLLFWQIYLERQQRFG
jgi:outer membrane protein insertion porin family